MMSPSRGGSSLTIFSSARDLCIAFIILSLSVVQQKMRVTRRIVLPLLTKSLYKFGYFEGILQKAKLALLLFYWVALTRFCMIAFSSKISLNRFITANFSVLSRGKMGGKLIKGSFNKYVDRILPFFDPPPLPYVDTFYTLSVDKNRHFWPLPPLILSTQLLNGPQRDYVFQKN